MQDVVRERRSTERDLHEFFARVASGWDEDLRRRYLAGFSTPEQITGLRQMYAGMLSSVDDIPSTTGCDLGCWLGFSSVVLASLGARLVYGVEADPQWHALAAAYRDAHALDSVRFRLARDGVVPLLSGSVDWVVINQVLCNAVVGTADLILSEAERVLGAGGTLALCDSNNPHCPETLARLRRNFRQNEIGEGTLDEPDGCNHRDRREIIREAHPRLDDETVERLSRETCYMGAAEVRSAVQRFLATGATPRRVFREGALDPTVSPRRGIANGNITDPYAIAARLEALGFASISISCSPASADLDNETLFEQLTTSQGFYVIARKPG